jgi:hypothetical protein
MPITGNVAWDECLATYKGRDTSHFVTVVAAAATDCAACGLELLPGDGLSLVVDISDDRGGDGVECVTFTTCVCHRHCREPEVRLRQATGGPRELATLGALFTLEQCDGPLSRTVPVLAYSLVPVLTFREPGGELTSALLSVLLAHGFQLSLTADYDEILRQTTGAEAGVRCEQTESGLAILRIGLEQMYSHQLDPVADAGWLAAASHERQVLVMGGDYLNITETGLNIEAAATLGTLATGYVPFEARGRMLPT